MKAALLETCLESACHYADITDDRAYAGLVRSFDGRLRERRLAAVYGCSSLPGISGALALSLVGKRPCGVPMGVSGRGGVVPT